MVFYCRKLCLLSCALMCDTQVEWWLQHYLRSTVLDEVCIMLCFIHWVMWLDKESLLHTNGKHLLHHAMIHRARVRVHFQAMSFGVSLVRTVTVSSDDSARLKRTSRKLILHAALHWRHSIVKCWPRVFRPDSLLSDAELLVPIGIADVQEILLASLQRELSRLGCVRLKTDVHKRWHAKKLGPILLILIFSFAIFLEFCSVNGQSNFLQILAGSPDLHPLLLLWGANQAGERMNESAGFLGKTYRVICALFDLKILCRVSVGQLIQLCLVRSYCLRLILEV